MTAQAPHVLSISTTVKEAPAFGASPDTWLRVGFLISCVSHPNSGGSCTGATASKFDHDAIDCRRCRPALCLFFCCLHTEARQASTTAAGLDELFTAMSFRWDTYLGPRMDAKQHKIPGRPRSQQDPERSHRPHGRLWPPHRKLWRTGVGISPFIVRNYHCACSSSGVPAIRVIVSFRQRVLITRSASRAPTATLMRSIEYQ